MVVLTELSVYIIEFSKYNIPSNLDALIIFDFTASAIQIFSLFPEKKKKYKS